MLSVYVPHGTTLERIVVEPGSPPPDNAVWIDMVTPTVHEDKLVEQMLGIAVPTREEMQEIEVSSRLYVENGARYMTATLMCQSDTPAPKTTRGHLHSVRPSSRDRALRRPAALRHRRAQARAHLPPESVRGERADGPARCRHRPLRRHPRAHRRRGRPGLAFDFRAGGGGQAAVIQRRAQGARPQGRPHLEGAREPGVDRAPAACFSPTRPTV